MQSQKGGLGFPKSPSKNRQLQSPKKLAANSSGATGRNVDENKEVLPKNYEEIMTDLEFPPNPAFYREDRPG